jgi:hypothetical protein
MHSHLVVTGVVEEVIINEQDDSPRYVLALALGDRDGAHLVEERCSNSKFHLGEVKDIG